MTKVDDLLRKTRKPPKKRGATKSVNIILLRGFSIIRDLRLLRLGVHAAGRAARHRALPRMFSVKIQTFSLGTPPLTPREGAIGDPTSMAGDDRPRRTYSRAEGDGMRLRDGEHEDLWPASAYAAQKGCLGVEEEGRSASAWRASPSSAAPAAESPSSGRRSRCGRILGTDSGLSRGKPRHRHAVGRARDVIEPHRLAESN
jgi:hypothetical protein